MSLALENMSQPSASSSTASPPCQQVQRHITVTNLWNNGCHDLDVLADLTNVSKRSIDRYHEQLVANGKVERKQYVRAGKISSGCMEVIRVWLEEKPSLTCKDIASRLASQHELEVSAETVRRELNKANINYQYRVAKPKLSPAHKVNRMAWCRNYSGDWPWEFVVFSDESYFQLERNCVRHWSAVPLEQRRSVRSPALMVWAAISSFGTVAIKIGTGGIKADTYQKILQEELLPGVAQIPGLQNGWWFQHDNAPAHNALSTRQFMVDKGINVIDWPAVSPDLNIIEKIWAFMKRDVEKDLMDMGEENRNLDTLRQLIMKAWTGLDQSKIDNLYRSIASNLNKCYANGGDTI